VDNEIALKWKIYISKLKPVKDIEGLIIKIGPLKTEFWEDNEIQILMYRLNKI
jgi:hypothetical protein